jgi:isoleucyl-tRNA synthetase
VTEFEKSYPADFICEAIDQTRGWFYTLMAVGTLVFDQSSYRNVLCLGHILDEEGRKMSKHLGNVLDPIALMDEHGADSVRWFMLASGSPWHARRVGHNAIAEVWRKTLSTYWSTVSFQVLYAQAAGWTPDTPTPSLHVLDRWALSRAHHMVGAVDAHLEAFDSQGAGRELATFIDDLSNWYVRRSRRRFWDGDAAALSTLHECLRLLTLTMAPFTPFITERVWQDLFAATGPQSVHLADWPQPDEDLMSTTLEEQMDLVRRLVDLGRTARGEVGIGTRQPLATALIAATDWPSLPRDLRDQVADELNCQVLESLSDAAAELVEVSVKPNFRALGRRFGKQTPLVAAAIADLDPVGLVAQLRAPDPGASVHVPGMEPVQLGEDDVVITETPKEGWAVATQEGETVALDLHLTQELVRLGLARQVIRVVQEARKAAGFDVSDRITLRWDSQDDDVVAAMADHGSLVADEVLAVTVTRGAGSGPAVSGKDEQFRVWVARA